MVGLAMTRQQQLLLISVLVFFIVTVFGCLFLILLNRIVPI
jgi:hypothetical protein